MERLAGGKKGNVDRKEMRSMTRRNYANLPEIKKKKDEEKLKAELALKRATAMAWSKE
jgi:hypothetical protein